MYQFKSLSEFHRYSNLPKPEHPLISLVDYSKVNYPTDSDEIKWVQDFYSIGLKRNVSEKFNYGQQPYDFNEGVLSFVAPQQILNIPPPTALGGQSAIFALPIRHLAEIRTPAITTITASWFEQRNY